MNHQFFTGNAVDVLAELPSQSVQCVVTSPPYFGLRDYKTGRWDGGDPECSHQIPRQARTDRPRSGLTGSMTYVAEQEPTFNGVCGICGAVRVDEQIGKEETVTEYVKRLVGVYAEVWRVLRDDGVFFLNLGDSYASAWPCGRRNIIGAGSLENGKREARPPRLPHGLKEKDLIGIPWRVAFALQADGWYLRSDVIWSKPNPMPESVTDRPTKAHEYVFVLTKQERYFWDADAVKEPALPESDNRYRSLYAGNKQGADRSMMGHSEGDKSHLIGTGRNIRSVWTIATQSYAEAHFATFPPELAERCIKAATKAGDTVLDPCGGSGTVTMVADRLERESVYIDLSADYTAMAKRRLASDQAKRFTWWTRSEASAD